MFQERYRTLGGQSDQVNLQRKDGTRNNQMIVGNKIFEGVVLDVKH